MEWLERFVSIMDAISESAIEGLGVTELSSMTGLSKGTLHRTLSAMRQHNLVTQNADSKKYRLGPKALAWGSRFVWGQDPSGWLAEYCDILAERTNLFTFLCRIDNGQVYCIYTRQPNKMRNKYFVHVGQRMPLHASAAAKVLLAFLPKRETTLYLGQSPLTAFTEHTATEFTCIEEDFEKIKQDHMAFCQEELEIGVSAISIPVFFAEGQAAFSISLISDTVYINAKQEFLTKELRQIGDKASEQMRMIQLLSSERLGKDGVAIC